jgi:YegS/Rv2252/BmrU family lipid kinase
MTTQSKAAVIINPVSRPGQLEDIQEHIEDALKRNNFSTQFYHTVQTTPACQIATDAINHGAEIVLAAGGDGTVMEVINAVIGINVPLGIIPLGTGNLLAINLGIPTELNAAIEIAIHGHDRMLDVVSVNDGERYFAIMAGLGFDAQVMDGADRQSKQRFGRLAYIWSALQYIGGELFDATISFDHNESMAVKAKSLLIANMGLIDNNIRAFPNAVPDDGIMEVGVLKASDAGELARLVASAVMEGTPDSDPAFDIYPCRSVEIKLAEPQLFECDGDISGRVGQLTAEIVPHAVRLRTPGKSDRQDPEAESMAQSADPAAVAQEIMKNFEDAERLDDELTQERLNCDLETDDNTAD